MTDIRPDSRHWWHHPENLGGEAPPTERRPGQSSRFQGYQQMIFSTLEDAAGELSEREFCSLLDIVGRRVSLLLEGQ